jgi:hypothetical protein
MHEQVWQELDEQGIGKVLTSVVVKISVHPQMWTPRTRSNQVASVNVTAVQGATPCGRDTREHWKVEVSSHCAGALDEKRADAATTTDSVDR